MSNKMRIDGKYWLCNDGKISGRQTVKEGQKPLLHDDSANESVSWCLKRNYWNIQR